MTYAGDGEGLPALTIGELGMPGAVVPGVLTRTDDAGVIIAYLTWRQYAGGCWAINDLLVLRDHRLRGLGRNLMQEVLDKAFEADASVYLLAAAGAGPTSGLEQGALEAWYGRLGFVHLPDLGDPRIMGWAPDKAWEKAHRKISTTIETVTYSTEDTRAILMGLPSIKPYEP